MWAGTRLSPGFMLIHGPRDDEELATVRGIERMVLDAKITQICESISSPTHRGGLIVPRRGQ